MNREKFEVFETVFGMFGDRMTAEQLMEYVDKIYKYLKK